MKRPQSGGVGSVDLRIGSCGGKMLCLDSGRDVSLMGYSIL